MKILKYLVLFGFVGLLVFVFFRYVMDRGPRGDRPLWTTLSPSGKPMASFSKIAEDAVLGNPSLPKSQEQVPTKCVIQWASLAQSDFKSLFAEVKAGQFSLDSECDTFEKEVKFLSELHKSCELSPSSKLNDEKMCMRWLKIYRAYLIDKMSFGETDYSRLPLGILISKVIGRMTVTGGRDIEELRKMAEQIRHRQSDQPSSYKLLLSVETLSEKGDFKKGAEFAEAGLQLDPTDLELQSAWFYFKGKDPSFKYEDFTDYPYGRYFLAARSWNEGKQQDALSLLEALVRKYPSNEHFQITLEKAKINGPSSENPFSIFFDINKNSW